jgi:hypothetical protein
VRVKSENAFCKGIHYVPAWRGHYRVAQKVFGKRGALFHKSPKLGEFRLGWKPAEKKKKAGFLKTETAASVKKALHDSLYADAAVKKFSLAGNVVAVLDNVGNYFRYFGKTDKNALSAYVPKPALYLVLRVKLGVDSALSRHALRIPADYVSHVFFRHAILLARDLRV